METGLTRTTTISKSPWPKYGLVAVVAVLLLIPAIWNDYPLIYFDTEDYVETSFTWAPILWRIMTYSVFCALARPFEHLWPVVIVQSVMVAWVLREAIHAFLPRWRNRVYIVSALVLVTMTGLPIVTSEVLADVFAGLAILGIATLALGFDLPNPRRWLLVMLTAIAIAVHMSHVAVACGMVLVLLAMAGVSRFCARFPMPRLIAPIVATALGTLAVPTTHWFATGDFYISKAGHVLQMALFVQDGLVKEYLDVVCPEGAQLKLCAHKEELPQTADEFLWGESPFPEMGGWAAMHDEADSVVKGVIQRFPLAVLKAMAANTWQQMNLITDGEDMVPMTWHFVKTELKRYPRDYRKFHYAMQQRQQGIDFEAINAIHVPVAYGAELTCLGLLLLAWIKRDKVSVGLIVLVTLAFIGNAIVCGALSNPHDRYQNRIVWLAVFVSLMTAARQDQKHFG